MIKTIVLSLFLVCSQDLLSYPKCIDLADPENSWTWDFEKPENQVYPPFNGAPEIGVFLSELRDHYGIDAVVETGTSVGDTTLYFSLNFPQVHTVEISEDKINKASISFLGCPHVNCYLGSSDEVLRRILPELRDQRILFYLDAHGFEDWPLLGELDAIARTHKDNCIIVIDDFKVPNRPDIEYDYYGKYECSYEFIKDKLDEVYTDYSFHYLIPRNPIYRAKLIVIPK